MENGVDFHVSLRNLKLTLESLLIAKNQYIQ